MAGTLRAEANLAAANALFLVLLFLGGMAYPLVEAARRAAGRRQGCCPRPRCPTRCARCSRRQPFPTGQLVVLVAWAVLAPLAAARWFRWEE